MITGDHDDPDSRLAAALDCLNDLFPRGIDHSLDAGQDEVAFHIPIREGSEMIRCFAIRHGQHSHTFRGKQMGGAEDFPGTETVLCHTRRAEFENFFGGSFDKNVSLLTVRVKGGHVAALGFERNQCELTIYRTFLLRLQPRLDGRHNEGPLRRVSVYLCLSVFLVEKGLVAKKADSKAHKQLLPLLLFCDNPFVKDLALRIITASGQVEDMLAVIDDFHRHFVFREGACLVRADDRRAPECFHGRKLSNDGVSPCHSLDADGKSDGQYNRQTFRYGGDSGSHHCGEHSFHGNADENANAEEGNARCQNQHADSVGEPVKLDQERSFCGLCSPHVFCYSSQNGPRGRFHHETTSPPAYDYASHEGHVALISGRQVVFQNRL